MKYHLDSCYDKAQVDTDDFGHCPVHIHYEKIVTTRINVWYTQFHDAKSFSNKLCTNLGSKQPQWVCLLSPD